MDNVAGINRAIDDLLVNLGEIVLRLSVPAVTRSVAEHAALTRSVEKFATCAASSHDVRVQRLAMQLAATQKVHDAPALRTVSKPNLRLILCND